MKTINQNFARNITRYRHFAEIKQIQAAKAIGITAKTLSQYENGKTAIPNELFNKFAVLYKTTIKNLLTE